MNSPQVRNPLFRRLGLALLLCVLPTAARAQFDYMIIGGGVRIGGYHGPAGDITVPNTLAGLPVYLIAEGAFSGNPLFQKVTIEYGPHLDVWVFRYCTNLTSAVIAGPDVGDIDFGGCTNLAQVSLGDGVTYISYSAFDHCTALTNIVIPKNVNVIDHGAFAYCTALPAISVDPANLYFKSVDGILYDKSASTLVTFPAGKKGCYAAPNSVTKVAYSALEGCTKLATVVFPAGLTNLGPSALRGCSNLAGIYFRGTPPSLGSSAFEGDTKATVYYIAGTSGWGPTFGGLPTAPWKSPLMTDPAAGKDGFGFMIFWGTNLAVSVDTCTSLKSPAWIPLETNALASGSYHFRDLTWTSHAARFFRLRRP